MEKTIKDVMLKLEGHEISVTFGKETFKVHCVVRMYQNGRIAVQYLESDGCPFGMLTVNIPEYDLGMNEIIVRTTEENEPIAVAAILSGLFKDTGKKVRSGFIQLSIWEVIL